MTAPPFMTRAECYREALVKAVASETASSDAQRDRLTALAQVYATLATADEDVQALAVLMHNLALSRAGHDRQQLLDQIANFGKRRRRRR